MLDSDLQEPKKNVDDRQGRLKGTCKIIQLTKLHDILKRPEKIQSQLVMSACLKAQATIQDLPEATLQGHRLKALGRGAVAALQLTNHPALPWHS